MSMALLFLCYLHGLVLFTSTWADSFDRSNQSLRIIPADIPVTTSSVNLENNLIESVPRHSFIHLTRCSYLRLLSNQISLIVDGAFSGLHKLSHLYLGDNKITNINHATFENMSVQNLYMGDNQIRKITETDFMHLTTTTRINLKRNRIERIEDGAFATLIKLKQLYLNYNRIIHIGQHAFNGLNSLEYLYLDNNQIVTLQAGVFKDIKSPRQIYLNYNKLTDIFVDTFHGCEASSLILLLDNNQLSTLNFNIFSKECQEKLKKNTMSVELIVHTNPLQCDDRLDWLKDGEARGYLSFFHADKTYKPPSCVNNTEISWRDVTLLVYTGTSVLPTIPAAYKDETATNKLQEQTEINNYNSQLVITILSVIVALLAVVVLVGAMSAAIYCYKMKRLVPAHSTPSNNHDNNESDNQENYNDSNNAEYDDGYTLPTEEPERHVQNQTSLRLNNDTQDIYTDII